MKHVRAVSRRAPAYAQDDTTQGKTASDYVLILDAITGLIEVIAPLVQKSTFRRV
jgi:hypothetical protein